MNDIKPPRPMTPAERQHRNQVATASGAALCVIELQSQLSGEDFWRAVVLLARNDALLKSVLEHNRLDIRVPDATKREPLLAAIPAPRMPVESPQG